MDSLRPCRTLRNMEGATGKGAHVDVAAGSLTHDRLSALPDCLLHIILSRVGSLQVVQTCVLSRRWRHLWRSVRTIDLDDRDFLSSSTSASDDEEEGDAERYKEENVLARFEEFADNLLFQHRAPAPPLDAFRLCVDDKVLRHTNYGRWLRRGVGCCAPAALHVRNRGGQGDVTASCLAPGSRRLTRLRLEGVSVDDGFLEQLGALFPALEDLELRSVSYHTARADRIASATLRNLTVDNCRQWFDDEGERVVAVVAPRLATLRLSVPLYPDCMNTPCFTAYALQHAAAPASSAPLARASVRVADTGGHLNAVHNDWLGLDMTFERNMAFLESLRRLLGSLSGASCLELSGLQSMVVQKRDFYSREGSIVSVPMLQALLGDEEQGLPVFRNLQTLVLGECDLGDDLQALWSLLQKAPALENLHLQHCELPDSLHREGARNLRTAASNLKLVEIKYKDDDQYFAAMPDKEEHARDFHEVLADISQELQTVEVIKVQQN